MKKLSIIVGAIVGFLAAVLLFTFAPNWLQGEPATAQEDGERQMIIAIEDVEVIDGVETVTEGEVVVSFDNPPEIPAGPTAVDGIFKSQEGDTIFVGTGSIEVEVSIEQINDQEPVMAVAASHSGPELSVVITADTRFYLDLTPPPEPNRADLDMGEMSVVRTVEPSSAEDLGEDAMLQVWGVTDGDTITADVVLISPIR